MRFFCGEISIVISTVDIGRPPQASELFQKYAKLSKKVGQQDALPGLCVLLQREQMVLKNAAGEVQLVHLHKNMLSICDVGKTQFLCGGRVWVYDTKVSRFQHIVEVLSRTHSE